MGKVVFFDTRYVKKAGDTLTGPLLYADGNAANPSIAFSAESGVGLYRGGTSRFSISAGGVEQLRINTSGISINQPLLPLVSVDIGATGSRFGKGWFSTGIDISVSTGTAPLIVASQTQVTNLNCSLLGGRALGTSGSTVPLCASAITWSAGHTYSDGLTLTFGTSTGIKLGGAANQKIGLYGVTAVIQPASANQAALTDSTTGTAGFTLVDVGIVFSQGNINSNFASLNRQVDAIRTALVALGAMKGAA